MCIRDRGQFVAAERGVVFQVEGLDQGRHGRQVEVGGEGEGQGGRGAAAVLGPCRVPQRLFRQAPAAAPVTGCLLYASRCV